MGSSAGQSDIADTANTFIGAYAGQNNSGSSNNVFIGLQAGQNNSATGAICVYRFSSGSIKYEWISNVFVGLDAGQANVAGSYNIAIGPQVLDRLILIQAIM